ncbi:MAG TPA: fused MFS/spermidine synthase [Terracidiphilus sp.]|nr:fused MFS/spermidine synthase [Terracidiphilus sp.]
MLVIIFTISMFLSAALLFVVEPILAKMMLPLLGGTPAVWNTCMVFFQATLLGGYLYAHGTIRYLNRAMQTALQIALVVAASALLLMRSVALPSGWEPPPNANPALWLIAALFVMVGLPFFVLSSTAPVLQHWFANSRHRLSADPYFLYAASNAGSLAGLLCYPFLLETTLRLSTQRFLWSKTFPLLALMVIFCAVLSRNRAGQDAESERNSPETGVAPCGWKQKLRWVTLAFVPSSLMLGVTTRLTTDVPSLPLFWVLPLATYLISFILVFARRKLVSHEWMARRMPALILCSLIPQLLETTFPLLVLVPLYLALMFCIAMVCHGELSRERPAVQFLTEFYLWISVGGVLGGIFNSLVAPAAFHSVLEFPIALVLAAFLRPTVGAPLLSGQAATVARRNDWVLPVLLGAAIALALMGVDRLPQATHVILAIVIFGVSTGACFSFCMRSLRFALGLVAILLAANLYIGPYGHILDCERSYFGVTRVTNDESGHYRYLLHGGTLHGLQSLDPARAREPLSYYTRGGPAGEVMSALSQSNPRASVAVVGLGAGSMACLGSLTKQLTFYEIDPIVLKVASNPLYFTFLQQCASDARFVLGDARLRLKAAPDDAYNLIVLDAFSGDSIPMHLLTREALALYLHKLVPNGVILFHVTNHYVQLAPKLADLARDAGLVCMDEADTEVTPEQTAEGKFASEWVVMARSRQDLALLQSNPSAPLRWTALQGNPGERVWTDDYSNLLSVIRWH